MNQETERPAPIRTDQSNAFANKTMRLRLPAIIDDTIASNSDYPPSIKQRLCQLRDELADGAPIKQLDPESAGDALQWADALARQREIMGEEPSWHKAEWFFAETYAYRCLIEAVRWAENGRDPFQPKKLAELHGAALWRLLERALQPANSAEAELRQAVALDLWANRIDLSYAASMTRGTDIEADDLLVDDREPLLAHLFDSKSAAQDNKNGTIIIVADNAGSELALDLALSDCLLRHVAGRVIIYLKSYPTFVSDATPADVWLMLAEMERRGSPSAALAKRLRAAWRAERLRFLTQPFWTSSRFLWDLPAGLKRVLNEARLVIIKGDANYRRTVGDCIWPPQQNFGEVLNYLAAAALCLRTLKSDPVVGLPSAATAAALDRVDPAWRVNGKRGLIQFKAQLSKRQ